MQPHLSGLKVRRELILYFLWAFRLTHLPIQASIAATAARYPELGTALTSSTSERCLVVVHSAMPLGLFSVFFYHLPAESDRHTPHSPVARDLFRQPFPSAATYRGRALEEARLRPAGAPSPLHSPVHHRSRSPPRGSARKLFGFFGAYSYMCLVRTCRTVSDQVFTVVFSRPLPPQLL
jgi:hypothetical protein